MVCHAIYNAMAMKGEGSISRISRGKTRCAIIPAAVADDSQFPFEDGEKTVVIIEPGRLVITKKK
jgi:hypothetical protein